jgi:hypothetical protein
MSSSPESPSSCVNRLTAAEARARLPSLCIVDALNILCERGCVPAGSEESATLYTHYLVARGDFVQLTTYLDSWDPEARARIVNTPHYETYFGNTLHTCAYWNTGHNALAIYRYLVANGATPMLDHYDEYPWQMNGSLWICPVRGYRIGQRRASAPEFTETLAEIERHFGLPAGAGAASGAVAVSAVSAVSPT